MNFMLMLRRDDSDGAERGACSASKGLRDVGSDGAASKRGVREERGMGGMVAGAAGESEKKQLGEKLSVGREERREGRNRDGRGGEGGGGGSASVPLLLHPRNGFIGAGGQTTIEVRCVAPLAGWQKYVVVVRNLSLGSTTGGQHDHTLAIKVLGHGSHPMGPPSPTPHGTPPS
jgi:hypothetical protein